jgi:hypothetical protein
MREGGECFFSLKCERRGEADEVKEYEEVKRK